MNKTPKEQIIELHTGKTVEEIEENNRIVKTMVGWQPFETAPHDREFLGVWGANEGHVLGYDVYHYIGEGVFESVNAVDERFPTKFYKIFAWMDIPKYKP